jgi:hypothetical protein
LRLAAAFVERTLAGQGKREFLEHPDICVIGNIKVGELLAEGRERNGELLARIGAQDGCGE